MDVVKSKQEEVSVELTDVRARINNLDEHNLQLLDTYLEGYFPPPKHGSREGVSKWLASGEGPDADQTLLDVLRWHEKVIADQEQSPRFMAAVQQSKAAFLHAQAVAIESGYVSANAATRSERVINANIYVGDVFNTLMRGALAWHPRDAGERYIIVAQGVSDNPRQREDEAIHNLHEAAGHEYNHVELDAWMQPWREEALAEHLEVGYSNGRLDALDPDKRKQLMNHHQLAPEGFRLVPQRRLLNFLRKGPKGEVPVRYVTQAGTSRGQDSDESRRYNEATDEAWGASLVNDKVDYLVRMRQQELVEANSKTTTIDTQVQAVREVLAKLQQVPQILADENWAATRRAQTSPPRTRPTRNVRTRTPGMGAHRRSQKATRRTF
jgi:hypothetical protein